MSKFFNSLTEYELYCMEAQWEARINEAWELHEAGQDLMLGIQDDQPKEFPNLQTIQPC